VSCRKDVPKGQLIKASGFVVDNMKNKRLSHVTVYLYGAHATFYGVYFGMLPLDSAVSDNNGNFSLTYGAEGNSVDYALGIGNVVYGGYTGQTNCVVDVLHPLYPFNYSHQLDNIAISARELNYVRINLRVLSNPYDSLWLDISTNSGELFLRHLIFGTSIDTSILTRCLPNAVNNFEYKILAVRLEDSSSNFIRRIADTINVSFVDTVVVSKTIKSTYNIPLMPY
jgi:hypothetical protein